MDKEELEMAQMLMHAMVEAADKMGVGVEMIEHLGEEGFRVMMDGYREYEKR